MHRLRQLLAVGGLSIGLTVLAACGGTTLVTNTVPVATTAATVPATVAASARPSTAPGASATAGTATRAATAATTPIAATATRPATSSVATATRPGATSGTATRTGSPTATVLPAQAVANLQQLDNSRQAWVFSGYSIANLSGDLRPVFEYNGGNKKVTLTTSGVDLEAYRIGNTLYVRAPIGGVIQADAGNPLAAPAQALFDTPPALFSALVPAGASYTIAGTETVNGRQATRYTASIALNDLAFVNPALAGQGGTAATTVWVDSAQGVLVALQSNITASGSNTTATTRLDVTNIGTTPAITVPR